MLRWLKEKLGRGRTFQAIIFYPDRSVKVRKIEIGTENFIDAETDRKYYIDEDRTYVWDGRPTAIYHYDNPQPINPYNIEDTISSAKVHDAIEEEVTKNIIRHTTGSDDEIKKLVLLIGGGIAAVNIGAAYMIIQKLEKVPEILDMLDKVMKVLEGGGM